MSKSIIINIIGVIVVISAGFFLYRYYFPKEAPAVTSGLTQAGFMLGVGESEQDQFLQILLNLQSLEFKTDVLPLIASLSDFGVDPRPQTPGRTNPFAPIGVNVIPDLMATTTPDGNGNRGSIFDDLAN